MKKLLLTLLISSPAILFAQVVRASKDDENKVFEKIEIEAGYKVDFCNVKLIVQLQ